MYVAFDVLYRFLASACGYDVQYVRNFTDIDDKIIARAQQVGGVSAHSLLVPADALCGPNASLLFGLHTKAWHNNWSKPRAVLQPCAVLGYACSQSGVDPSELTERFIQEFKQVGCCVARRIDRLTRAAQY